ncbi:MAG: 16S rRNA (guanine(527)-N(7))-methyltransferase RsmG [Micavibrio sp.]|nr:MAG: 16S rRNA (guanine(527)-N(7))-methyltransferase RsmG [Micavibrio sp.]
MNYTEFCTAAGFDVSRETFSRLESYAALLEKWQAKINLVGPKTLPDLWRRHFLDSAQIFPLIDDKNAKIADLGSGAGFPGLVLAALGCGNVHLVESDRRKCTFLREVARACDLSPVVTIHNCRIEEVGLEDVQIVTARALAPLSALLSYAEPLLAAGGVCLFLKGAGAADEIKDAARGRDFSSAEFSSKTAEDGVILRVSDLRKT